MTPEQKAEYDLEHYEKNRARILQRKRELHRRDPRQYMLSGARKRASQLGLPFDLTKEDLVIPSVCPVLGIPVYSVSGKGPGDNSPSLDRLIPHLGYVRGNVVVISQRANRIKNDASAEELETVASWLRDVLCHGA